MNIMVTGAAGFIGSSNEVKNIDLVKMLIKKELGWSPLVSFKEGIDLTVEWYRNAF